MSGCQDWVSLSHNHLVIPPAARNSGKRLELRIGSAYSYPHHRLYEMKTKMKMGIGMKIDTVRLGFHSIARMEG